MRLFPSSFRAAAAIMCIPAAGLHASTADLSARARASASPRAAARAPARAPTLDGIWESVGYGFIFEIKGSSLSAFERSAVSCLPSFTATFLSDPVAGAEASMRIDGTTATILVLHGASSNEKKFHENGSASDMLARRLPGKPAICDVPTPNTPASNFDTFAQTWAEQYGFFDVRKVNWPSIVAANRPKISASTTPVQLFDVLRGMIEPLGDAHTFLAARDIDRRFHGFRGAQDRLPDSVRSRVDSIMEQTYLRSPLRKWCNGQVQFATLDHGLGYLRISSFNGYGKDYESGLVALEAALDSMFAPGAKLEGLVIDVRRNGGGADPYGLAIAARLTAKEYEAYAKQARSDPANPSQWTVAQPSIVRPSTPGFHGAVVELIGIHSVSAAETFTQALLKRAPKVTRVGENTQGVFSDVLGRVLPNGWRFGLPNERFVTDGRAYDGAGIPPDIALPSFQAADLKAGRDGALEKAIEILSKR